MKYLLLTFSLLVGVMNQVMAQVDFTPIPGYQAWCPNEEIPVTLSNGANCGIRNWTIVYGKIKNANGDWVSSYSTNLTGITIKWDDVSQIGKLKVTCSSSSEQAEKSYVISSLNGLTPNVTVFQTLNYCATVPISIFLQEMYVINQVAHLMLNTKRLMAMNGFCQRAGKILVTPAQ